MFAICSCSGTSKSSKDEARTKFERRTGITLPAEVSNWEFFSVHIGDTYGEYFKFTCTRETFIMATEKLKLTPDPITRKPSGSLWSSQAKNSTPNDPAWWKIAQTDQPVYHKQDYIKAAHRSVMTLWYDKNSSTTYMKVSFWD